MCTAELSCTLGVGSLSLGPGDIVRSSQFSRPHTEMSTDAGSRGYTRNGRQVFLELIVDTEYLYGPEEGSDRKLDLF